ncbi:MAG: YggS family pyridoxal phosphate-dependent enzyme [Bacteroidales bacterium]|nr:YggS family pyridoxal phosphate-dependent enzyme [Bacteroidales bacterium]MDD4473670.1 YggS family pyridoxal phosphate-dependent enzyme [Bacteroidales bacterium]
MMIPDNVKRLRKEIPGHVSLVAVSKFQPVSLILQAYNAGQRIFGENRSREMTEKIPLLPNDIQWHFIGHLQTNKVREVVGKAVLIQSVDRIRLLNAIQSQAQQLGIIQDVLLQIHIAREDTKHGFLPGELPAVYELSVPNVRICGVMGMATFTDNTEWVRREFRLLRNLFDTMRNGPYAGDQSFVHCSMGMTGDYHIALEEGSTMVRIGSAIFPPRPQKPG